MAFNQINNGESGLSVRTNLNSIIDYLNVLGLVQQFSTDNLNWHSNWVLGDAWFRLSQDFGATWTNGIYLNYTSSGGGGWTSVEWDETNGNLNFYKDTDLDFTVNLDGRYALKSEAEKSVFNLRLPSGASVQERIDGAVPPTGWTLAVGVNDKDLVVSHNTSRFCAGVTVFLNTAANHFQQMTGTQAYSNIYSMDENRVMIEAICTIQNPIDVFITIPQP